MSDKATPRISLAKSGAKSGAKAGGKVSAATGAGDALRPDPPLQVKLAVAALIVSAVASIGAAAGLFGAKDWLLTLAQDANDKLKPKDQKTATQLVDQVNSTPRGLLIPTVVVAALLVFLAYSAYRGKHWSRWAIIGVWVLTSFTQMLPGFTLTILGVGTSSPIIFKVPAFIAGIAALAAVILSMLKPSVAYFNFGRPVRPGRGAGRPAGGRGLFASRAALLQESNRQAASTKSAQKVGASTQRAPGQPDRSKSKARANTDAVAKGAELARSRAKASKSRRPGS